VIGEVIGSRCSTLICCEVLSGPCGGKKLLQQTVSYLCSGYNNVTVNNSSISTTSVFVDYVAELVQYKAMGCVEFVLSAVLIRVQQEEQYPSELKLKIGVGDLMQLSEELMYYSCAAQELYEMLGLFLGRDFSAVLYMIRVCGCWQSAMGTTGAPTRRIGSMVHHQRTGVEFALVLLCRLCTPQHQQLQQQHQRQAQRLHSVMNRLSVKLAPIFDADRCRDALRVFQEDELLLQQQLRQPQQQQQQQSQGSAPGSVLRLLNFVLTDFAKCGDASSRNKQHPDSLSLEDLAELIVCVVTYYYDDTREALEQSVEQGKMQSVVSSKSQDRW